MKTGNALDTFKQLNSWELRTFGEADKPKILDNLIRHVLFGGEAKNAEVAYLRLGWYYKIEH